MAGFFDGSGLSGPPQGNPQKQPTQNASMMQIMDEWKNRYQPYVYQTLKDPISGGDSPVDIQTFIEWRKQNPGPWN